MSKLLNIFLISFILLASSGSCLAEEDFLSSLNDKEVASLRYKLEHYDLTLEQNEKLIRIIENQKYTLELYKDNTQRLGNIIKLNVDIEKHQMEYVEFIERKLRKEQRENAIRSFFTKSAFYLLCFVGGLLL